MIMERIKYVFKTCEIVLYMEKIQIAFVIIIQNMTTFMM